MRRFSRPTWFVRLCAAILVVSGATTTRAAFDLQFTINPTSFTANQLSILNQALGHVEAMWENVITGYQPGINISSVPITVQASFSGLASASYSTIGSQGGFTLATSGFMNVNVNEIENFANWQGVTSGPTILPGNGLNFIDEILAHETGHALGIGTLWTVNNVYVNDTFHYTGANALAAYKSEFDPAATFVPVENAGNPGTPNAHWDQLMRSSPQEGNPNDPWSLDPRVGVTDAYGRDRGLELMTGGVDPDYREPFISRTTVQSMRDLGYTVTSFEDANGDGAVTLADLAILKTNFGATGLQIDSMVYGDADRDRDVDGDDILLWQRAYQAGGGLAAVPEPTGCLLALIACLGLARRCSS